MRHMSNTNHKTKINKHVRWEYDSGPDPRDLFCGGAEGTLPSECPGREMTMEEEKGVYLGELDFSMI